MLIKSLLNQQDEDEDENLAWGVHQETSGAPTQGAQAPQCISDTMS